ncbi:DNA-binding transcriptional regulator, XRE-family HTH domain [Micromonospora citrea]|uniref:DNA-binding transcriptional regulator, XRE-family HTH domain n=1 Tax=Micromonospora citrea TaxID=47855 RepID=A0A1C6VSA0_9ACTN|nr:helix-turn-helix transcriptional regulator [Micromonospora citrea]SCL69067.1 DNA-binding transcriptional regulator, XRE-family HTH domain [Micromonospora citrea]
MALKRHRLCQRRKALGFSQERLAEALGVERSTVARWESAETDPQPWHRTRIAAALHVTLEQLDDMLVDVSVATGRGQAMGDDTCNPASAIRSQLLIGLRAFLTSYLHDPPAQPTPSLADVRRGVVRVHTLYQRASYSSAARLLPEVLRQATELTDRAPGARRIDAFRLLAAAYLAASKLASKVGDGDTALLAADRAWTAARLANHRALAALAAYQAACGLLRLPGRADEAAAMTQTSIEHLVRDGRAKDPDLLSAHGALLLLAAVIAARRDRRKDADDLLVQAEGLAAELGSDQNRLWTGFGPTNVVIHTVSAAVESRDAERAFDIASRLDTSRLPAALVGRRAQVHVDLAAATAMGAKESPLAVLHILEAERVAPEVVRANAQARNLLTDLLSRERRAATPGLRPLAERAGLLA